ncbi:hypothetical protein GGF39_002047 [Coemansia sp. RSA 1721]|nr:hypothetical protein GGF39_002047 [Coemansia sp. RSA 1721]
MASPDSTDSSSSYSRAAASDSTSTSTPSAQEYQDCLPCKLVGAGAMAGVAGYALHARSELDPVRFAARRRGLLGLSLAFVGVAFYRLCQ